MAKVEFSVKKNVLKRPFTFRKWKGRGWRKRGRKLKRRELKERKLIRRLKKKLIRAEAGYLQLGFQVLLIEITSADCRLSLFKLVLVQNLVFINYNKSCF